MLPSTQFLFFTKHFFVFDDYVMQRTAALSCLVFIMLLLLCMCADIEQPAQLVNLTQKHNIFGTEELSRGKETTKLCEGSGGERR